LSRPLVTALIDTYNYGRFVEEAIDSVLAQDYPSDRVEILVVDDGSIDDTAERVQRYGSRIQYLQKPNGGQASAFNFGFERSKGEIIAFLDADASWLSGKLSAVVRAFEENSGTGLVYHRRKELNSATGQFTEGDFSNCAGFLPDDMEHLLDYRVLPTSSLAFSRQTLARMLPMPEFIRLQADAYIALLVVFLAPVVAVSEDLCVYRIHGKNLFAAGVTDSATRRQDLQMQKHLSMRRAIFDASMRWLMEQGFDVKRPDIYAYFERLYLFLEAEEFAFEAPTRKQFFRYMWRNTKLYWRRDGWKLRMMNLFNTVASVPVGYAHFSRLYQKEVQIMASLRRLSAKRVG
jgi:glycosyltransferase involved in cell wall biosynthesis